MAKTTYLIKSHHQDWGQCRSTAVQLTSADMAPPAMPHSSCLWKQKSIVYSLGYNLFGLCGNMMLLKFSKIKKLYNIKTKIITWVGQLKWGQLTYLSTWRYASTGLCESNVSVCPSVRLSVTRRYCVKTKKASVMISSPSGSPKVLVFWCQISSRYYKGFPRAGEQGWCGKIQPFSSFKHQYLENGST